MESLVYLIQFLVTKEGLPWPNSTDFEELRKAKEEWVPPYTVLQELLVYARNRRCDGFQLDPYPSVTC